MHFATDALRRAPFTDAHTDNRPDVGLEALGKACGRRARINRTTRTSGKGRRDIDTGSFAGIGINGSLRDTSGEGEKFSRCNTMRQQLPSAIGKDS